ncbi:MAG: hypothetical protein GWN85_00765, partial [Gemmatimonadetes bacterium]|nr:hypothetical protein [Gemmatimonadota bacterium]NIR34572.1 hypothetical protein [Actinomycetota bacterium]
MQALAEAIDLYAPWHRALRSAPAPHPWATGPAKAEWQAWSDAARGAPAIEDIPALCEELANGLAALEERDPLAARPAPEDVLSWS